MGTMVCCAEMNPYNSGNSHIFQINRYFKPSSQKTSELLPDSQKETMTSTSTINTNPQEQQKKRQTLKNKNGEYQLLSYDPLEENFFDIKLIFPIIKTIEGMSELSTNNKFFLCGISPKQKNEGSFLFQVNLDSKNIPDDQVSAEMLINSQYPHIYPSLIMDKNEQIICVGGKGQKQCEIYNLNANKWFTLPQLPEERHRCTLCLNGKGTHVYLFGGYNNIENYNQIRVLRMNLIQQLIWENLLVKNTPKNLIINRFQAGAFTFKYHYNYIFIVGGEDSKENKLDSILRFSIQDLKFESTNTKLTKKAIFMNQSGAPINEQAHCLIDNLNNIHLIEMHDCLPIDYHADEI